MEILDFKIFEKEAEYVIEKNDVKYEVSVKFDLENAYEPRFNPGSFYGFYERYSGKTPIDLEFSPDFSQEINDCIEEHLLDSYDSSNFQY